MNKTMKRRATGKSMSYLGLSQRAGKLVSGDENVLKSIRSGEAKIVVIASDASDNTRKKLQDKCNFYHVKIVQFADRAQLGESIGKEERVVLAVTDQGLATLLEGSLEICTEVEGIEQTRK